MLVASRRLKKKRLIRHTTNSCFKHIISAEEGFIRY